jgi:hypothetical protein
LVPLRRAAWGRSGLGSTRHGTTSPSISASRSTTATWKPCASGPRFERTIQELADEHVQLAQSLDALIGAAATARVLDDGLREQVRLWIDFIRRHEKRENDLVQDAFNLDVSAED